MIFDREPLCITRDQENTKVESCNKQFPTSDLFDDGIWTLRTDGQTDRRFNSQHHRLFSVIFSKILKSMVREYGGVGRVSVTKVRFSNGSTSSLELQRQDSVWVVKSRST